ncbi:hypothetical protein TRFO_22049 [Tritrichomonas foetus]|uniref:Uncharacterized protein n=1 Tax=Tritrichomonas foetus TaxID=1144522 RepID=A0A1J4KCQ2_9EUKA|nr:hypothetical protein TRFO_22049 [Tritrichomonas foetus]|eukprot:OHT09207.1 hypothetical protein TRFO_22049 [Tritrichomonas foetus]
MSTPLYKIHPPLNNFQIMKDHSLQPNIKHQEIKGTQLNTYAFFNWDQILNRCNNFRENDFMGQSNVSHKNNTNVSNQLPISKQQVTILIRPFNQTKQHENITEKNRFEKSICVEDSDEKTILKKKKGIRQKKYGSGDEAKNIKTRLNGFESTKSEAYSALTSHFGKSLRLFELIGIVNSLHKYYEIKPFLLSQEEVINYVPVTLPKVTRDERRSFPLMVKYIEDNKDKIIPILPFINLCDKKGDIIVPEDIV